MLAPKLFFDTTNKIIVTSAMFDSIDLDEVDDVEQLFECFDLHNLNSKTATNIYTGIYCNDTYVWVVIPPLVFGQYFDGLNNKLIKYHYTGVIDDGNKICFINNNSIRYGFIEFGGTNIFIRDCLNGKLLCSVADKFYLRSE